MKKIIKLLGLYLLVSFQTACAQQEKAKPNAQSAKPAKTVITLEDRSKTGNPLKQLSQLVKLECEHNKQCKTIGVGALPCGGSPKYLVYSTQSSDVSKLTKMVESYNKKQRLMQNKKGLVGICQHIPAPKTFCAKQTRTCVTARDSSL